MGPRGAWDLAGGTSAIVGECLDALIRWVRRPLTEAEPSPPSVAAEGDPSPPFCAASRSPS